MMGIFTTGGTVATRTPRPSAARAAVLGVATAIAVSLPAEAQPSPEYTTFQPFWYQPAQAPEGCQGMGLLNLPAGWSPGDAAVVVVTHSSLRDATRDPLVAGLLQEGAAVLEIAADARVHCVGAPERRVAPPPGAAADLAAIRRELARYGAGVAVAIGYGSEGETVLRTVAESADAPEPRYAAAVAIVSGAMRFARGALPGEAERWTDRAGRLCAVLVAADRAGSDPAPCASALRTTTVTIPRTP